MFCFKKVVSKGHEKNKGSIMIHTLLICMLLLPLVFYIFSLEIYEMKYNINREKYINKENQLERVREYTLTELNSYITTNIEDITEENIKKYFQDLDKDLIIEFENAKLTYNKVLEYFEVIIPYDEGVFKVESYKVKVNDGRAVYSYYDTKYMNSTS